MKIFLYSFLFSLFAQVAVAECTPQILENYKSAVQNFKSSNEYCTPSGPCTIAEPINHVSLPGGLTNIQWGVYWSNSPGLYTTTTDFTTCTNYPEVPEISQPPVACAQSGSIVHPQTQNLGEVLSIVGAPFQLQYFTNRVKGRTSEYISLLRVSEGFYYYGLDNVRLIVKDTSGQIFHETTYPYSPWDQRGFGWTPSSSDFAGKKFLTFVDQFFTDNTSLGYLNSFVLGNFRAEVLGLGGWYPSNFYFYGHDTSFLYKPDGTTLKVTAMPGPGTNEFYVASEDGDVVYIFNELGFHKRTVTNLTGVTLYTFQYNSNWSLDRITERSGRFTQFNRNASGKLTNITTSTGKVSTVTLTTEGYLSTITDPLNKTHTMTYVGTGGLLGTFQKPTGEVSTFSYSGDVLYRHEHSGGRWATMGGGVTYDGFNGISYDTRLGKNIVYIDLSPGRNYSGFGRSKVQSNVGTVTFHKSATNISEDWGYYSVSSEVAEDSRFKDHIRNPTSTYQDRMGVGKNDYFIETSTLTDPLNPWSISALTKKSSYYDSSAGNVERITTSSFNPTTRTWTTTSPMGRTSTSILDTQERVTSLRKGNLNPITFTYEMDQIKTQSHTTSRVTTYNYNSTTRLLTSVVNPLNQSTNYSYDSNERLIAQTFPDLKVVQYAYDDLGRLTGVTPPSRPQHVFTFNSQEQMGSYLAPTQTQGTSYAYDFDNRITSITKPSGTVLTFDFDPIYHFLNQIVSPSSTISYTRSAPTWNPTTIANTGGFYINQTFTGQALSTQSLSDSALNFIGSMQTNYNDRGLIASQILTNSTNTTYTVNRTYNADELLTQVGSMTLGYSGMPNGLLNKTTIQTLIENITTSLFDEVTSRDVKKGTATLFSEALTRDNLGRITRRVMAITGWPTVTYNYLYDNRGRLKEVQNASLSWIRRYTYDDNGNRLTAETASPSSTVTSTTNSQDQLITSGVYTYTYNLNGELQTRTNTLLNQASTYTYDDFGNLTQVVLENGDVIAYEIDGLNRRVGKKKNNVLIERYLWNENQLIAELNPNNTIKRRYIYVTKSHVPDYYVEGTTNYKIVTDSLGSPVLVLKASDGTVIQRIEYDEFGRVLQDSRSGELVIGYAGGVSDWDTKLVRFGARDYDAVTGRWTSKDPILFQGGDANLYGYVENDPVNSIDPKGMSAVRVGLVIAGGLCAAYEAYDAYSTIKSQNEYYKQTADINGQINQLRKKQSTSSCQEEQDSYDDQIAKLQLDLLNKSEANAKNNNGSPLSSAAISAICAGIARMAF